MVELKHLALLLMAFLLGACATAQRWDGTDPNFQLSGEAARQELDLYTFKEEGFLKQREGFHMGRHSTLYTLDSLAPMIERQAPEASERVSTVQRGLKLNRKVGWVSLALLLAGSLMQDDLQTALVGLGSVGAVWWAGRDSYLRWQLTKVAPLYNEELQSKFAPRFSWIKHF